MTVHRRPAEPPSVHESDYPPRDEPKRSDDPLGNEPTPNEPNRPAQQPDKPVGRASQSPGGEEPAQPEHGPDTRPPRRVDEQEPSYRMGEGSRPNVVKQGDEPPPSHVMRDPSIEAQRTLTESHDRSKENPGMQAQPDRPSQAAIDAMSEHEKGKPTTPEQLPTDPTGKPPKDHPEHPEHPDHPDHSQKPPKAEPKK